MNITNFGRTKKKRLIDFQYISFCMYQVHFMVNFGKAIALSSVYIIYIKRPHKKFN